MAWSSVQQVIEQKMCVLIFSTNFCLKHFSYEEETSEIWSKMDIGNHVKYPLLLQYIHETWILSTDLKKKKKTQWSNFMKIRPVGAELFQGDLQIDNTKVIVAFQNFVKAPKNHSHTT